MISSTERWLERYDQAKLESVAGFGPSFQKYHELPPCFYASLARIKESIRREIARRIEEGLKR